MTDFVFDQAIQLLEGIFGLFVVAIEVPSGYLADRIGRVRSMRLGVFCFILGMSCYSQSSSFSGFLLAELFLATGIACLSGADEALVYDNLDLLGRKREFRQYRGMLLWCMQCSFIFYNLLGGWLSSIDFRYPFYLAIFFDCLLLLVCLRLKEVKNLEELQQEQGKAPSFLDGLSLLLARRRVLWLSSLLAYFGALLLCSFWIYQLYLESFGLPLAFFGLVFAGMNLVSAEGARLAHRVHRKMTFSRSLRLWLMLLSLSFVVTEFGVPGAVLFFLLQQSLRGMHQVVIKDYLNRSIPSRYRATLLSVNSMLTRLLAFCVLIPNGWVYDSFGLRSSFAFLLLVSLSLAFALLHMRKIREFKKPHLLFARE